MSDFALAMVAFAFHDVGLISEAEMNKLIDAMLILASVLRQKQQN